jgi:murein DD-endopeptidase MepM/ murein hydrolase activator NlpD
MLVACRVLQGMGGAMMVPVGRMTLVRAFPKSEMIRAMSFDIDFQREIQTGDSFELLFEQYRDGNGRPAKTGAILFAGLTLGGKPIDVYSFTTKDGGTDFYTATGDSVRKALLRTPVDGFRVSSGFGMRKHPILGYS